MKTVTVTSRMTRTIAAILCLAALPAVGQEETTKLAEAPKAEAPRIEEHKRSVFRRTTFAHVAPRKSWVAGSETREIIGSRRKAREARLARQQERIDRGFTNPFAQRVDTTPISAPVALPPRGMEVSPVGVSVPKPERQTQPGEFRPKIYGLD